MIWGSTQKHTKLIPYFGFPSLLAIGDNSIVPSSVLALQAPSCVLIVIARLSAAKRREKTNSKLVGIIVFSSYYTRRYRWFVLLLTEISDWILYIQPGDQWGFISGSYW